MWHFGFKFDLKNFLPFENDFDKILKKISLWNGFDFYCKFLFLGLIFLISKPKIYFQSENFIFYTTHQIEIRRLNNVDWPLTLSKYHLTLALPVILAKKPLKYYSANYSANINATDNPLLFFSFITLHSSVIKFSLWYLYFINT